MRVTVLRPFAFSRDGVKAEQAIPGEIIDLLDGLVEGLVRERFVSAILPVVEIAAPAATVVEPAVLVPQAPAKPAVTAPKAKG